MGGSELAKEWIEFENDIEKAPGGTPRKHCAPRMKPPKSVNCKLRQVKRKSCRMRIVKSVSGATVSQESDTKSVKTEEC